MYELRFEDLVLFSASQCTRSFTVHDYTILYQKATLSADPSPVLPTPEARRMLVGASSEQNANLRSHENA